MIERKNKCRTLINRKNSTYEKKYPEKGGHLVSGYEIKKVFSILPYAILYGNSNIMKLNTKNLFKV